MPSPAYTRFTLPRASRRTAAEPADLWDLVDQAQAGNADAFGDLFHATAARLVFPYVLRRVLGDRSAAEEITADVYLSAWRGIHGLRRGAASPAAWLMTIAARRTIDHHRVRQYRNTFAGGAPADLTAYRPTSTVSGGGLTARATESICLDRDEARTLWDHVRQLSADQHRVIRCRFEYGLSIEQTAVVLGKRATAVKSIQHRAMLVLRDRLAGSSLDPARRALVGAAT